MRQTTSEIVAEERFYREAERMYAGKSPAVIARAAESAGYSALIVETFAPDLAEVMGKYAGD